MIKTFEAKVALQYAPQSRCSLVEAPSQGRAERLLFGSRIFLGREHIFIPKNRKERASSNQPEQGDA